VRLNRNWKSGRFDGTVTADLQPVEETVYGEAWRGMFSIAK
jgi:hypothetical protein